MKIKNFLGSVAKSLGINISSKKEIKNTNIKKIVKKLEARKVETEKKLKNKNIKTKDKRLLNEELLIINRQIKKGKKIIKKIEKED